MVTKVGQSVSSERLDELFKLCSQALQYATYPKNGIVYCLWMASQNSGFSIVSPYKSKNLSTEGTSSREILYGKKICLEKKRDAITQSVCVHLIYFKSGRLHGDQCVQGGVVVIATES